MPVNDQYSSTNRYTIIPRTLSFITRGDSVLLLKGAEHKVHWANLYNGLGGHIERGEDILTSARRELFEESGLEVHDLWLCGVILVDAGERSGVGVFVFRGESLSGNIHETNEGKLEWVKIDHVMELPLVEDLSILLPRILSLNIHESPFIALTRYDENQRMTLRFAN
jgi:8-oxo-dGTP diphosphatase